MGNDIRVLAQRLFNNDEILDILRISSDKDNLFANMFEYDKKLGGPGIHNINKGNTGRYSVKDRDIFRPIQYIYAYFKMKPGDFDWVTREIVHMCGLHLESLVKRLFSITRYPLGQALALPLARLKLDKQLLLDLKSVINPYNNAKHHMDHTKDSHLFDVETALLYYVITRHLSLKLLEITHVYTDAETWNSVDDEPTDSI